MKREINTENEYSSARGERPTGEEKFRFLAENIPGVLYLCKNDDQYTTVYVNDYVETLTGYPKEEFTEKGRSLVSLYHPDDVPDISAIVNGAVERKKPYQLTYRIQHRSGEWRWVEEIGFGIYRDGKVLLLEGMICDKTEQKKIQVALEESEQRRRRLINATPDIICFKDGQGRWLEANDADLQLFELTDVDYRGKTDAELAEYSNFYREAFLLCEETDEKAWTRGVISRGDEVIPTPNGETKVYDVIKIPVFNTDGSRKGLVVLGRDITERKKTEEKLERLSKEQNR